MTIRKKIILFSAVALGAFLAAVYLVSRFALMNTFAALESESAQRTVHQVQNALQYDQSNLEIMTHGYAQSDAAYEFLDNKNADYARTTLTPDTLNAAHIDLIVVLDNAANVVFNRSSGTWSPDANEVQTIAQAGQRSAARKDGGKNDLLSHGILEINGHLMMISYGPVLPASGIGLSRGTLIMARELDQHVIADLSKSLGFPVWIEPAPGAGAGDAQGIMWSDGVNFVRTESDSTLLSYVAVRDFSSRTCALLASRTQRSLYLEGQKETRYLWGLLLLAGAVYCGSLLLFVDEILVRRIAFLGDEIGKVTVSGDLSTRLNCKGKDELSTLARTLNTMLSGIQKAKTELLEAQESLRFHAEHDALTGVLNRRAIRDVLRKELARCRRESNTLGVILADVDHFKKINDHYGHGAGDAVLVSVVQRISSVLRSYDTLGRYGGEEFLIIAPNCDFDMAQKLAERVRSVINDEQMDLGDDTAKVSVSMGVTLGTAESDPEFLVAQADTAMYSAKRNGRNRIEVGLDLLGTEIS
jgi:diguanylate cyclase (GGDEF)-like protein